MSITSSQPRPLNRDKRTTPSYDYDILYDIIPEPTNFSYLQICRIDDWDREEMIVDVLKSLLVCIQSLVHIFPGIVPHQNITSLHYTWHNCIDACIAIDHWFLPSRTFFISSEFYIGPLTSPHRQLRSQATSDEKVLHHLNFILFSSNTVLSEINGR